MLLIYSPDTGAFECCNRRPEAAALARLCKRSAEEQMVESSHLPKSEK